MTDIKQLAIKAGASWYEQEVDDKGFLIYPQRIVFSEEELESLLAEYLLLSSSEPLAYILRNEYNESNEKDGL
ncbi:MAG: hypothetical protein V4605_03335 [Pseudomonadota bacterium]